ncbi:MAG: hypothetical protein AB7Q29_12610 [Vicinamibacterales bacterium]
MRPVHLYLLGYFLLVIGAGLALWRAGVVDRLPGFWLAASATVAVGLGVALALLSARPRRPSADATPGA